MKLNKIGYVFVYGNLILMSLRHVRRILASKSTPTFINLTASEVVEKLWGNFIRLNQAMVTSVHSFRRSNSLYVQIVRQYIYETI